MTMYTIAGHPVSEEEFERAAHICLGKPLDRNLVSTVFEIFDKDGMCVRERGKGKGGESEKK